MLNKISLNIIRQDILKTLAYFDIFNYPLTKEDIRSFMSRPYNQSSIEETLSSLLFDEVIFRTGEFYSLQNKPSLAEIRQCGNKRAIQQLSVAKKAAGIIFRFPYVQAVAISGSLSKNFADEKADIDFFIITTANRLWIARTLMHLFKKLTYLAGKQHWFCMNYYIDEAALEIKEKNIFTAMEIVTLLPMHQTNCFQNFIKANAWTNNYFPLKKNSFEGISIIKKGWITKFTERIFNSRLGNAADKWLMNLTDKRWKKKTRQGKLNDHGTKIGMNVGRHFSKPDPKNFQAKVLQQYETKIQRLLEPQQVSRAAS
jgi:hypothetical protein